MFVLFPLVWQVSHLYHNLTNLFLFQVDVSKLISDLDEDIRNDTLPVHESEINPVMIKYPFQFTIEPFPPLLLILHP